MSFHDLKNLTQRRESAKAQGTQILPPSLHLCVVLSATAPPPAANRPARSLWDSALRKTPSLTGWPINSHAAVSSVKTASCRRAAANGAADDFHAKRLRRLHRPQFRAVKRPPDQPSVGGFLDGVRDRLGRHRRAGFQRAIEWLPQSIPRSRRAAPRHGSPPLPLSGESASRPFQTESCLSLPPSTMRNGF